MLGVLGGGLIIAAILSPRLWGSFEEEPVPSTPRPVLLSERAARALFAGDVARATQWSEEALAEAPRHAPTLFLQACLSLEAGETQAVQVALTRLQAVAPDRPEPRLLLRLLAHRVRAPEEGWRRSFLRAWSELGRPSFTDSPLLPDVAPEARGSIPDVSAEHTLSGPVRLTLVLAMPRLSETSARWLMDQLPGLEDAALVHAASITLLTEQLPPTLHTQTRGVVLHRLSRLVKDSPSVMQPRLLRLWAKNSEWVAFSQDELEELEAVSSLPTWKNTSLMDTFLEARAHLKEAGLPHPGVAAFDVARISNNHWGIILLSKRAEATRAQLLPGSRHRLGLILWRIGSLLSQDSTVFASNSGLQLMSAGATDMGDEAARARAEQMFQENLRVLQAADQASLERWPLPSLWEEVAEARARDEWAHLREFAGSPVK